MATGYSKKSLIAKLAEACNAVGGVEKKGRNEFQSYNYVKASDIAKAIRRELFSRGIIVILDEKEWTQIRTIKTNAGGEMPEWLLKCEVTFQDGAEKLGPFGAFGVAADKADKAIYKAKTGALKYVLRGIGLIPDEKDDPEFDESVDEQTDPRVIEGGKPSRKKKGIAEYQARAWSAAIRDNGHTPEQESIYLKTRFKVATVMDLTPQQFTEAIKWALGTEDLAATMTTSATAIVAGKKQPAVELAEKLEDEFDQRVAGD